MRIPDLTNCTRLRLWQPVHAGITSFNYKYLIHTDTKFHLINVRVLYGKQEKAGIHGLLTGWFCTAQSRWV